MGVIARYYSRSELQVAQGNFAMWANWWSCVRKDPKDGRGPLNESEKLGTEVRRISRSS